MRRAIFYKVFQGSYPSFCTVMINVTPEKFCRENKTEYRFESITPAEIKDMLRKQEIVRCRIDGDRHHALESVKEVNELLSFFANVSQKENDNQKSNIKEKCA